MEMSAIVPFAAKRPTLPLLVLLKLNQTLKKTLFSRNFYQQINDKVLARTATLDSTLYFVCYFTLLLSAVLNNKPQIVAFLRSQKDKMLRAVERHFGVSTASLQTPQGEKIAPPHKSALAVHLKAVSSYISDIRIFNRLTEAIKYTPWIIDEFAAMVNPALAVPRLDRVVNFAQAINCLMLELFENAGWLTDHNWIGTSNNEQWCLDTYVWLSRVWGAYLVIEIIELLRRTPVLKWDKSWRIKMFTQAVQLPLVLHWSLYEGCLTPFWVGLCGSGASYFGFRDVMRSIDLK